MTAQIIPFPVKPTPFQMESVIRKHLAELSADNDLIESVAERMMIFIENYTNKTFDPIFDLTLPTNLSPEDTQTLLDSIHRGVDRANLKIDKMISEIILERLFYEVAIYEYRKKHPRQKSLNLR